MPINYNDGPPTADPTAYIERIATINSIYSFNNVLVWDDMENIASIEDYVDFYNVFWDGFGSTRNSINLWGPNITVTGGASVTNSADFVYFLENATSFHGLSFYLDGLTDAQCADVVDYFRNTISYEVPEVIGNQTNTQVGYNGPLCITIKNPPTPTQSYVELNAALKTNDIVLWPSEHSSDFVLPTTSAYWEFEGTLRFNQEVSTLRIRTDIMSSVLNGANLQIEFWDGGGSPFADGNFPRLGQTVTFSETFNANETYSYKISALPRSAGQGTLKFTFTADNQVSSSITDSIVVVSI